MIDVGKRAPEFALFAEDGCPVGRPAFRGRPLVLYFYPKDDTSGCTAEARDFSRLASEFEAIGVEVMGVSPDSAESHCKFKAKHELAVRLASDPEHKTADAYGVWVEKSMYGKTYMGVARTTFLIGLDGTIEKVFEKVKPEGHADEILEFLSK